MAAGGAFWQTSAHFSEGPGGAAAGGGDDGLDAHSRNGVPIIRHRALAQRYLDGRDH